MPAQGGKRPKFGYLMLAATNDVSVYSGYAPNLVGMVAIVAFRTQIRQESC